MKSLKDTLNVALNEAQAGNADESRELCLYAENTREIWSVLIEPLIKSINKKSARGEQPSVDTLANSSVMKKIATETIRLYSKNFGPWKPSSATRALFIQDLSQRIIDSLEDYL